MLLWKKISKDDLVLTCGVAFLEIEWTIVGSFFIDSSLNQTKYHNLLSNEISNFLDEIPLAVLNRVVKCFWNYIFHLNLMLMCHLFKSDKE
jgi:hypothetical protein